MAIFHAASIEDMLEENAWRARNGLDDLAWNPDAVAPPLGDVYARERRASVVLKVLAVASLTLAAWGLVFLAFTWAKH